MSSPTKVTTTAKQKKLSSREKNRAIAAERKREAARAKAAAEEAKAESLAPKVQREAVLDHNGNMIRGPRVELEIINFRRSNPVRHLVARSKNKPSPVFVKKHELAADRLLIAWETGANGISAGCTNYSERASGTPTTGMIADHVLSVINEQMRARQEVAAAQAFLGALWPVIYCVVIRGIDVSGYAEMAGMSQEVATGYVAAALDRLCELFVPATNERGRIRSINIAGMTLDEPKVSQ